jgi:hypothetical protein
MGLAVMLASPDVELRIATYCSGNSSARFDIPLQL